MNFSPRTLQTNNSTITTPEQPHALHQMLAVFNARRLCPALPSVDMEASILADARMLQIEAAWLTHERARYAQRAATAPKDADDFVAWFEDLREVGPGQNDPLFPFLAEEATFEQMRWFLAQEISGEAGFDDLVALTQVRMPQQAKLELARNYWDEMGRGNRKGMHGPMLSYLADALNVHPFVDESVWEATALNNLMVGLASTRCYAYHSIGALGVIELTAPGRSKRVSEGLRRLGVEPRARRYFDLHATLDIKHSEAWNRDVLHSIVKDNPQTAAAIAEGALMRLHCGQRCFERYRHEFGI
jgi:hypothetical protein